MAGSVAAARPAQPWPRVRRARRRFADQSSSGKRYLFRRFAVSIITTKLHRRTHMETVTSKDGTTIAFDRSGSGPALILVDGALGQRALDSETTQLAAFPLLAQHFTVFYY